MEVTSLSNRSLPSSSLPAGREIQCPGSAGAPNARAAGFVIVYYGIVERLGSAEPRRRVIHFAQINDRFEPDDCRAKQLRPTTAQGHEHVFPPVNERPLRAELRSAMQGLLGVRTRILVLAIQTGVFKGKLPFPGSGQWRCFPNCRESPLRERGDICIWFLQATRLFRLSRNARA